MKFLRKVGLKFHNRDSKEIENIVNKMINDYETRDKKILMKK